MPTLHVAIEAVIDGDLILMHTSAEGIPPDYDQADTNALVVRTVEDTAFDAVQEKYGRQPTRRALIAAAARLRALEDALARMPRSGPLIPHRDRIAAIFALSNEQAIAQWGEDPEGG